MEFIYFKFSCKIFDKLKIANPALFKVNIWEIEKFIKYNQINTYFYNMWVYVLVNDVKAGCFFPAE